MEARILSSLGHLLDCLYIRFPRRKFIRTLFEKISLSTGAANGLPQDCMSAIDTVARGEALKHELRRSNLAVAISTMKTALCPVDDPDMEW